MQRNISFLKFCIIFQIHGLILEQPRQQLQPHQFPYQELWLPLEDFLCPVTHLEVKHFLWSWNKAKWIWDRSIYSIIKPSFDMTLFQYFWRFTQICKKFAAFAHKIVFVIVSVVKLFRNNNKNNFASKCCKFLANMCKSSEIPEQCQVKWWLEYRNM